MKNVPYIHLYLPAFFEKIWLVNLLCERAVRSLWFPVILPSHTDFKIRVSGEPT